MPLLPLKRKVTGKPNNREIMKPSMMIIALTLLTIIFLPATSGTLSSIDNNQAWAQEQSIKHNNSNIQLPNGSNVLSQNFNNSININYSAVSRPIDTLNATGLIGSIIPGGGQLSLPGNLGGGINNSSGVNTSSSSSPPSIALPAPQSLLFGKWFMNVKKGNVTNFEANFVMFKLFFGGVHNVYNVTGFKAEKEGDNRNANFLLNPSGMATINGTSNIAVNGTTKWPGVHTTITIDRFLLFRLQFDPKDTDNHFSGQPIYGSVTSLIGPNGTSIVKTPVSSGIPSLGGNNNTLSQILKPFHNLFGNK